MVKLQCLDLTIILCLKFIMMIFLIVATQSYAKKYSLFARYKAISNKNNEKPRYSIFDDIIKETIIFSFRDLLHGKML